MCTPHVNTAHSSIFGFVLLKIVAAMRRQNINLILIYITINILLLAIVIETLLVSVRLYLSYISLTKHPMI